MNELYHHGVKGMKWGVRKKYEPHPRKLAFTDKGTVVLKKGTQFQRIVTNSNSGIQKGVYTSYKISDRDLYKGVLGRMRISRDYKTTGKAVLKELSMTTKKDIRLPSMEVRLREFRKLYESDPKGVKALIEEHQKVRYNKNRSIDLNYTNHKKERSLYQKFNDALSLGLDSKNGKVIKKYYSNLSKLGYDAIPDENDIRIGTFKAQAPIIVFDTNKTVGKTKVKNLSASEIFSAYNRAMPKKTIRNIIARGNIGFEKLEANSDAKLNKYARKLAADKFALNKNYTLNNLAEDWGKHRLTSRQIRKVSDKMDSGKTHDEAVAETIALGNAAVDVILNKFGL